MKTKKLMFLLFILTFLTSNSNAQNLAYESEIQSKPFYLEEMLNKNTSKLKKDSFNVNIEVQYEEIKSHENKLIHVKLVELYNLNGMRKNTLQIKNDEYFHLKEWSFEPKQKISTNLYLAKGFYSIIINDLLEYNMIIDQNKSVKLELHNGIANANIFGTWEVKKWHGKYEVYISPSTYSTNSQVGYISWTNGCNTCGAYEFIISTDNKIKIINFGLDNILCTLLYCSKRTCFHIPETESFAYKIRKSNLVLKYKKGVFTKRIRLKKKENMHNNAP